MRRRPDGRHGDATTFQSSLQRADILTCTHLGRIHQNGEGKVGGEPDSTGIIMARAGWEVLGTTDNDGAS